MNQKFVSNRPLGGRRDAAGIGYVIIPNGKDKKSYIQSCLRTGTITLALENGGLIEQVLITKSALNDLVFPESYDSLGSMLVWINQPRKNQPIAIGIISKTNEFVDFNKESSALGRKNKDYSGEVLVDANKGVIIINSISSKDSGGDIYITSFNKAKTSKLVVNISGDINVSSTNFNLENSKKLTLTVKDAVVDDKITTITYEKGVGFNYKDDYNNEIVINEDNIQFKPSKKLNITDGTEPMMLSDTFKSIFEDFTDALSKLAAQCALIQVGTAMGTSTVPTNATDFTQISTDLASLKTQYKNFQSKQSFLD